MRAKTNTTISFLAWDGVICTILSIITLFLLYATLNLWILLNEMPPSLFTSVLLLQTIKDQQKKQMIVIVLFVCLLGCFKIITRLGTCMHYIEHGINLEFRTD